LDCSPVRIAEFSWAVIEPSEGAYDWSWLDEALSILHSQRLQVVMGTPTATPPKWLVDKYDILPVDIEGRVRKFGSRRHYSFSSPDYLNQTKRIVEAMASRYGSHPAVAGWQLDNEYGCHDTIRSYDQNALKAFRVWLNKHYGSIQALNTAWGNNFWSMDYGSFDEVDLPNLCVTVANPSHWLSFYRFSSDQLVNYNKIQADIVRKHSPGRFVTTNFMGFFFDFDTYKLNKDLDFPSWDSYPLGFTDSLPLVFSDEERTRYTKTGHPDVAAFHHDLYRAGNGSFWIMEQQPGPVNWADHNPSPADGMVRLWTLQAMSHGADVVSYFRWRESPHAQEQMHSGLLRVDHSDDLGLLEAKKVLHDLQQFKLEGKGPGHVAILFDFEAQWVWSIQPQGSNFQYVSLLFTIYSSLRSLGLDVDFIPAAQADKETLAKYPLLIVPSLPIIDDKLSSLLASYEGILVMTVRTGSKTRELSIPLNLAPGKIQDFFGFKVVRVESLKDDYQEDVFSSKLDQPSFNASKWKEHIVITSPVTTEYEYQDKTPAVVSLERMYYIGFWPNRPFLLHFFDRIKLQLDLKSIKTPPTDVRISTVGDHLLVFNFNPHETLVQLGAGEWIIGSEKVPPHGVCVFRPSK